MNKHEQGRAMWLRALVHLTLKGEGRPPTFHEIGQFCGYSSGGASRAIYGLERRGLVRTTPGESRSARITDKGIRFLADAELPPFTESDARIRELIGI